MRARHSAAPWQEFLVLVCHMVPALLLNIAWLLLVWDLYRGFAHIHVARRAPSMGHLI
jgi:hypothetical protein